MKPETVIIIRKLAREATIFALLGIVAAAIGIFAFMDNQDRANAKRQAVIAVHAGIDFSNAPAKPAPTVEVPLTNGTVLQVRRCPNLFNFDVDAARKAGYSDDEILQFFVAKPYFKTFSQADQQALVAKVDPDFAQLKPEEFRTFLSRYNGGAARNNRPKPKFDPNAPVDPSPDCRNFSGRPTEYRASGNTDQFTQYASMGSIDQVAIEKEYWTAYKQARHLDLSGTLLGSLYFGLLGFPAGLGLWMFYRLVRFAVTG